MAALLRGSMSESARQNQLGAIAFSIRVPSLNDEPA